MIVPTVGRKVWYRPSAADKAGNFGMKTAGIAPLDATIIAVWGDRCINIGVVDIAGKPFFVSSAVMHQEGDEFPKDANGDLIGGHAEWMPYQVGQAAKVGSSTPFSLVPPELNVTSGVLVPGGAA